MSSPLSRLPHWRFWPHTLIALAILLRLWHIWWSRANPTFWSPAVDPAWYDDYAQRIVSGDWGPFPLFRAPLYPALLAGVYAIFGHDLLMARILNVLIQAVAAWAIFRVGESYFSRAAGIIATGLFALNGMCIFYGGELLSVSLEILAAVIVAWSTLRLQRDLSLAAIIVCGFSWGLASIVRPNFLLVAPAAALAIFYLHWKQNTPRGSIAKLAVYTAALFVPILPVTAANWVKGHELVLIATQGGVNFWIGNNPESTGILSVLPGHENTWTMEDAELEAERETGRKLGQGELSDYYFGKGQGFLREHPVLGLRLMIRKTLLFFNRFEISNNKHITYFAAVTPGLNALIYLNFGLLVPLGLWGWWGLRQNYTGKFLLCAILLYSFSVVLFFVTSRFRLPAVPWLAWLAGAGIAELFARFREPNYRRTALLLLFAGGIIAHLNLWDLRDAPLGWARFMEGNAYMHLNQPDSARVCFEDAIIAHESVARARLNLGVLAYREQNFSEAATQYRLALIADPRNPEAWNNLGIVHEAEGDAAGAFVAYKRSLGERPLGEDARHNLAGLHFRTGIRLLKSNSDSLAIAHFDTCLSLEPTPVALYNRAIALGRRGQTERALSDLTTVIRTDPGMLEARKLLANLQASRDTLP
jgi:tetratricopeptide (TPR) repeat protein